MLKVPLIACALALAACAPIRSSITLAPDSGLLGATIAVAEAVDVAGARIVYIAKPGAGVVPVLSGGPGCGSWDGYAIRIPDECPLAKPGWQTLSLMHEVGHAYGLAHSKDKASIMSDTLHEALSVNDAARSLIKELVAHGLILLPPGE